MSLLSLRCFEQLGLGCLEFEITGVDCICISLDFSYFKQQVSWDQSTIKIADEVPRDHNSTINAVYFTAGLEKLFKENQAEDPTLRYVQ